MISFFKPKPLEKRKFKRLITALDVKFKIISGRNVNKISSSANAITKNICLYGLNLESGLVEIDHMHISHDASMIKKNMLDIELKLPLTDAKTDEKKEFDSIQFLGEVVWYNKKGNIGRYPYDIGVEIIKISEDNRSRLETFIRSC